MAAMDYDRLAMDFPYFQTPRITLMTLLFKMTSVLCASAVVVILTIVVGTKVAVAVA